jgi:uncharacterized membrane protein YkgB
MKKKSHDETIAEEIVKEANIIDLWVINWARKHGLVVLRYCLAVIFIWFGLLKPLGLSPASDLVTKTVYWFDPVWFVPFLGWWEVLIGVCLLWKKSVRAGIVLMALQMGGTFLPLVLLPNITWLGFMNPTLEGQYIIKNIVLIAAAIVIASHLRDSTKSEW